jgi:hypothetical protein
MFQKWKNVINNIHVEIKRELAWNSKHQRLNNKNYK